MHSHYLVVESKENEDGAQDGKVILGEKGGLLKKRIAGNSSLKSGVYYVRDPHENIRHQVQCQ